MVSNIAFNFPDVKAGESMWRTFFHLSNFCKRMLSDIGSTSVFPCQPRWLKLWKSLVKMVLMRFGSRIKNVGASDEYSPMNGSFVSLYISSTSSGNDFLFENVSVKFPNGKDGCLNGTPLRFQYENAFCTYKYAATKKGTIIETKTRIADIFKNAKGYCRMWNLFT